MSPEHFQTLVLSWISVAVAITGAGLTAYGAIMGKLNSVRIDNHTRMIDNHTRLLEASATAGAAQDARITQIALATPAPAAPQISVTYPVMHLGTAVSSDFVPSPATTSAMFTAPAVGEAETVGDAQISTPGKPHSGQPEME